MLLNLYKAGVNRKTHICTIVKNSMLEALITSKTRVKLLLKFFLNSDTKSYLRNLESEFGESSNAIRVELNRFEEAGLLVSSTSGNKKMFQANKEHSMFKDINNIIFKFVGIDEIVAKVLNRIGELEVAYIIGDFAKGVDSKIIDLVLVGENLNLTYVNRLIEKTEAIIRRKIRLLIVQSHELDGFLEGNSSLLIWKSEGAMDSKDVKQEM